MVSIDDFKKIEMKIGRIVSAENIEGSEKLLKLSVDFAETSPRQVLSGIARYFPSTSDIVGKHCAFVTNLETRIMMGMESQAMILAAGDGDNFSLFEVPNTISPGTVIK